MRPSRRSPPEPRECSPAWPEPLQHGDVALVAHGHLLRILAATYLREDARFGAHLLLDAGAVCVLEGEHGVPGIRSWNRTEA